MTTCTIDPLASLLNLLPDNETGDISAADMRTIITSLWDTLDCVRTAGGGAGGGSVPVGAVIPWPGEIADIPTGFALCDFSELNRTTDAELFGIIGTKYGDGDGVTTFNLPDYRGYFLRGVDGGAGIDPDAGTRTDRGDGTTGDEVGTKQDDENKEHSHGMLRDSAGGAGAGLRVTGTGSTVQTEVDGGNESRPKNIYVYWIIRVDSNNPEVFEGAGIALSSGTSDYTSQAHGLGGVPAEVYAVLRCTTVDLGFAVNDEVPLQGMTYDGTSNYGVQIMADATDIQLKQINGLKVFHRGTNVLTEITYGNWVIVVRARA